MCDYVVLAMIYRMRPRHERCLKSSSRFDLARFATVSAASKSTGPTSPYVMPSANAILVVAFLSCQCHGPSSQTHSRIGVQLTNLSAMELNQVRPFLTLEMDHLRLLAHPQEEPSVSTPLPGVPSAVSATPMPSSSSFVGSGGSGTSVPSSSTTATQPARRNLRPLYIQQEQ